MLSLPILSSLASSISSTIGDNFKDLFKPISIVAAGVFLSLNLVLILPPLTILNIGAINALESLPNIWKVLFATFLLLILGYIINNLGEFFLNVVNGSVIQESSIGYILVHLKKKKREELEATLTDDYLSKSEIEITQKAKILAGRAAQKLALEFPDDKNVAPNRLGNIIASATSYSQNQYGAHFGTLWPAMELSLKSKDIDLHTRLAKNSESLQFLASLIILIFIVAFEYVVVHLLVGPIWCLLSVIVFFLVIYIIYQAAAQRALNWGRDIRTAFDLYLDEVRASLNLVELNNYKSVTKRKERWEGISQWLRYGALKFSTPSDNIPKLKPEWFYKKPSTDPIEPVLFYPPTLNIQVRHQEVEYWSTKKVSEKEFSFYGGELNYIFSITNADNSKNAKTTLNNFLLVSDKRILAVPEKVPDESGDLEGIRQPSDPNTPEAILWKLPDIQVQECQFLNYSVQYETGLSITSAKIIIEDLDILTHGIVSLKLKNDYPLRGVRIKGKIKAMNNQHMPKYVTYSSSNDKEGEVNITKIITNSQGLKEGTFDLDFSLPGQQHVVLIINFNRWRKI